LSDLPPLVSVSIASSSLRDFNADNGIGGHYYSQPQKDSYPFAPSVLNSSYDQVDSGDPYPWNVHGSEVNYQTFVKRNHLYSLTNNNESLLGWGLITQTIEYPVGESTWTKIVGIIAQECNINYDLSIGKNTNKKLILSAISVLDGDSLGDVTSPMDLGLVYALGSDIFDNTTYNPDNNTGILYGLDKNKLRFPSKGFEYFMTESYTENNISSEAAQGFIGLSTSGFDIPFAGSKDISVDVWVQFEPISTAEIILAE
jgi:hypothetical protein